MQAKRFFLFILICALLFSMPACSESPSIGPDDGYAGKVTVSVNLGNGSTRVRIIEGDGARQLVQRLTAMMPTGEREEKITDAQWTSGYYPADETPVMTAWLETDSGIYRANLDKKTVCRVESHYAEGELLLANAGFFELVDVLSKYWPYHTDICSYHNGELKTEHKLTAPTTVKLKVKDVEVNKDGWENKKSQKYWVAVILEVESTVEQTVQIVLHPGRSGCVSYGSSVKELEMKAGEQLEVRMPLYSYMAWWSTAEIIADNTRIVLRNEDVLND